MTAASVPALVLRVFDYGESSQVVHLLTREQGRVHGIAKGARRMKGAFHGGADALTVGEVLLYPRRGSAELFTLGAFDLTEPLAGLRQALPRFHAASHVAAVLLAFCREEQPHPDLFDLALAALRLIADASDDDADALALGFEAMALQLLGFAPELSRCVVCSRPARNVKTTHFSPLRGGLLCRNCRAEDGRAVGLSSAGLEALRALSGGPLMAAGTVLSAPGLRTEVRDCLDAWTTALLDRPLRTHRA